MLQFGFKNGLWLPPNLPELLAYYKGRTNDYGDQIPVGVSRDAAQQVKGSGLVGDDNGRSICDEALIPATDDFYIEFTYVRSSDNLYQRLVSQYNATSDGRFVISAATSSVGVPTVFIHDDGGSIVLTGVFTPLNVASTIRLERTDNLFELYQDGELVDSITQAGVSIAQLPTTVCATNDNIQHFIGKIYDIDINGTLFPGINVAQDYEYAVGSDNYLAHTGYTGDAVQEFDDGTGTNYANEFGYNEDWVGIEQIVNGEKWTGASGSTPPDNFEAVTGSLYSVTDGLLTIDRNGAAGQNTKQLINTIPGVLYKVVLDIAERTSGGTLVLLSANRMNGTIIKSTDSETDESLEIDFVAEEETTWVGFRGAGSTTQVIKVSSLSTKEYRKGRSPAPLKNLRTGEPSTLGAGFSYDSETDTLAKTGDILDGVLYNLGIADGNTYRVKFGFSGNTGTVGVSYLSGDRSGTKSSADSSGTIDCTVVSNGSPVSIYASKACVFQPISITQLSPAIFDVPEIQPKPILDAVNKPCVVGDGSLQILIPDALTTDTIVAVDGSGVPTSTTNGEYDIASGTKVWAFDLERGGETWAQVRCENGHPNIYPGVEYVQDILNDELYSITGATGEAYGTRNQGELVTTQRAYKIDPTYGVVIADESGMINGERATYQPGTKAHADNLPCEHNFPAGPEFRTFINDTGIVEPVSLVSLPNNINGRLIKGNQAMLCYEESQSFDALEKFVFNWPVVSSTTQTITVNGEGLLDGETALTTKIREIA